MEYALALWFLLGILYPTLRTFWPFTLLSGIPAQWRMNMAYASIGYTLLGYYLAAYHPRPRRRSSALLLAAGLSRASFCVYLTHVFVLQFFARRGIRAADGPVLLTVPAVSLGIIVCCCGAYAVLSRIPWARKWLV